jgi:hypothetical protein
MGVESRTDIVVAGLERILGSPVNSPQVRKVIQESKERIYFSALQAAKDALKEKGQDPIVRMELARAKAKVNPTTDYQPFADALRGIFGAALGDGMGERPEEEKEYARSLFRDLSDYVADDCQKIVHELTARQREYRQFYDKLEQASPNRFKDRRRKEAMETAINRVGSILDWFKGMLNVAGRRADITEEVAEERAASPREHTECIDPQRFYTAPQAAEMLGITRQGVTQRIRRHEKELSKSGDIRRIEAYTGGFLWEIRGSYIQDILSARGGEGVGDGTYEETAPQTSSTDGTSRHIKIDPGQYYTAGELGKMLDANARTVNKWYQNNLTAEERSEARRHLRGARGRAFEIRGKYVIKMLPADLKGNFTLEEIAATAADTAVPAEEGTGQDYTITEAAASLGIVESALWSALKLHKKDLTKSGALYSTGKAGPQHLRVTRAHVEGLIRDKAERKSKTYRWGVDETDHETYYTMQEAAKILGIGEGGLMDGLRRHAEHLAPKGAVRRGKAMARGQTWEVRKGYVEELLKQRQDRGTKRYRWDLGKEEQATEESPATAAGQVSVDPERFYSLKETGTLLGVTSEAVRLRVRRYEAALKRKRAISYDTIDGHNTSCIRGDALPKILADPDRIRLETIVETATETAEGEARAGQERPGQQASTDSKKYYTSDEAAKILGITPGGLTDGLRRYENALAKKGIIRRGRACAQGFLWEVSKEYIDSLLKDREERETKRYRWNAKETARETEAPIEQPTTDHEIDLERYYTPAEAAKILGMTRDGIRQRLRKYEKELLEAGDARRGRACAQGFIWEIRGSYLETVRERIRKYGERQKATEQEAAKPTRQPPKHPARKEKPTKPAPIDKTVAATPLPPPAPRLEAIVAVTSPAAPTPIPAMPMAGQTFVATQDAALLCITAESAWMYPNIHYTPLQIARFLSVDEGQVFTWLQENVQELEEAQALKILSRFLVGGPYNITAVKADCIKTLLPAELQRTLDGKLTKSEAKQGEAGVAKIFTGDKPEPLQQDTYYSIGQIKNIIGGAYTTPVSAVLSNRRRDIPEDDKTAILRVPNKTWVQYRTTLLRGQYVPLLLPRRARAILASAREAGEDGGDAMRKALDVAGERPDEAGRWYNTMEAARALYSRTGRDQQDIVTALTGAATDTKYSGRVRTHTLTGSVEYHSTLVGELEIQLRPK